MLNPECYIFESYLKNMGLSCEVKKIQDKNGNETIVGANQLYFLYNGDVVCDFRSGNLRHEGQITKLEVDCIVENFQLSNEILVEMLLKGILPAHQYFKFLRTSQGMLADDPLKLQRKTLLDILDRLDPVHKSGREDIYQVKYRDESRKENVAFEYSVKHSTTGRLLEHLNLSEGKIKDEILLFGLLQEKEAVRLKLRDYINYMRVNKEGFICEHLRKHKRVSPKARKVFNLREVDGNFCTTAEVLDETPEGYRLKLGNQPPARFDYFDLLKIQDKQISSKVSYVEFRWKKGYEIGVYCQPIVRIKLGDLNY